MTGSYMTAGSGRRGSICTGGVMRDLSWMTEDGAQAGDRPDHRVSPAALRREIAKAGEHRAGGDRCWRPRATMAG